MNLLLNAPPTDLGRRDAVGSSPARASFDRMASFRADEVIPAALLGWWEGSSFRRSPASLLDVRPGEARTAGREVPPRGSTVWVRLEGELRTDWVEGLVVEIARQIDGLPTAQIALRETCPYAFFHVDLCPPPSTAAVLRN